MSSGPSLTLSRGILGHAAMAHSSQGGTREEVCVQHFDICAYRKTCKLSQPTAFSFLHTRLISDMYINISICAQHSSRRKMVKTHCCLCREAAASSANKGRKKTPEELSVEVLLHFAGTVRAFYASVAKAVHAQARRRDDPSFQPTASMKAASVTLGVILTRNLNPPNQVTDL